MKQGDLVRCTYQPSIGYTHLGHASTMEHIIKGRFGFLVSQRNNGMWFVYFPQIDYTHSLALNAFELVSEA